MIKVDKGSELQKAREEVFNHMKNHDNNVNRLIFHDHVAFLWLCPVSVRLTKCADPLCFQDSSRCLIQYVLLVFVLLCMLIFRSIISWCISWQRRFLKFVNNLNPSVSLLAFVA